MVAFEKVDAETVGEMSSLTLAHVGDAVFELLARTHVASSGACKVSRMHQKTVSLVSASAQARAARALVDGLSEEERAVFLRGRNAKPKTVPKNASVEDYAYATALEALFGMLYLTGRYGRIGELWHAVLACAEDGE